LIRMRLSEGEAAKFNTRGYEGLEIFLSFSLHSEHLRSTDHKVSQTKENFIPHSYPEKASRHISFVQHCTTNDKGRRRTQERIHSKVTKHEGARGRIF